VSIMSWFNGVGRHRMLTKALINYPAFSPPNTLEWPRDSFQNADENYLYFIHQKDQRLADFISWLLLFEVVAPLTEEGLTSLDQWFDEYGPHLVSRSELSDKNALSDFTPTWVGPLAHLNVLWDLGTFVGEFICKRNPKAKWCLNTGDYESAKSEEQNYLRPCVALNTKRRPFTKLDVFCSVQEIALRKKMYGRNRPAAISARSIGPEALRDAVREWST
jgi:hypothetical protein